MKSPSDGIWMRLSGRLNDSPACNEVADEPPVIGASSKETAIALPERSGQVRVKILLKRESSQRAGFVSKYLLMAFNRPSLVSSSYLVISRT